MGGQQSNLQAEDGRRTLVLETALLVGVRVVYFIACRFYVNAYLFAGLRDVLREDGIIEDDDAGESEAIRLEDAEDGVFGGVSSLGSSNGGGGGAGRPLSPSLGKSRDDGAGTSLLRTSVRRPSTLGEVGRKNSASSLYGRSETSRTYSKLATALFCLSFSESSMLFTLLLFGDAVSERCVRAVIQIEGDGTLIPLHKSPEQGTPLQLVDEPVDSTRSHRLPDSLRIVSAPDPAVPVERDADTRLYPRSVRNVPLLLLRSRLDRRGQTRHRGFSYARCVGQTRFSRAVDHDAHASWPPVLPGVVNSLLSRICVPGVVLIASLSGGGAVNTAWEAYEWHAVSSAYVSRFRSSTLTRGA